MAPWFKVRNIRFWALVMVLLYSLLGFFGLPWLIKKELPEFSQSLLGRDASVAEVKFNPWSLRLDASQLELLDTDNKPLAQVDQLLVNLQVSSLFYRALKFREASLTSPAFFITRYESGDSNIGQLVADLSQDPESASSEPAEESALLRLIIDQLTVRQGQIDITDRTVENAFSTQLTPINIDVQNLSTLADKAGDQTISITLEGGRRIDLSGNLQLNPLLVNGSLNLTGSPIGIAQRYLSDLLEFTVDSQKLSAQLDFVVADAADRGITAAIDNFQVLLEDVTASTQETDQVLLNLPTLRIQGGQLKWPEQTIRIAEIMLDTPRINIWRNADGSLNLSQLVADTQETSPEEDQEKDEEQVEQEGTTVANAEPESLSWEVTLDQLLIDSLGVQFDDYTLGEPGTLEIAALTLTAENLSSIPEEQASIGLKATAANGGQLSLEGKLEVLPTVNLTANLSVADLALAAAQPWAASVANIVVNKGTISTQGELTSNESETLSYRGDVQLTELDISDSLKDEALAGVRKLELKQAQLQLDAGELEISNISIDRPFARVIIDRDGITNFQNLATEELTEDSPVEESTATPGQTDPFIFKVGKTDVKNGSVDFSDLSLPLPFRALITEFGGNLSALSSNSSRPSTLDFDGKVGDYGLATLDGTVNVMSPTNQADVALLFRNVNMPDLSPYTVEFVGQKIESGKLDLDLLYTFNDRKMEGKNKLVLDKFVLGEQIENEDAMSLPLGLAVALLKDVNGVIDLQLSVAGDMDDPSFSIGGIVLKALANLIIKAAAAPFKLLGALIPGGGEDDFGKILFEAGDAELTPPELEKLDQLAAALVQRPNLRLEVPGNYDEESDVRALKVNIVDAMIAAELGDKADEDSDEMLTQRTRKVLEKLAKKQLVDLDLRALREQTQITDPETGKQSLDEVALIDELHLLLETAQQVSEAELIALAEARQKVMIDYLLNNEALANDRVKPATVAEGEVTDEGWIVIELGLEVGAGSSEPTVVEVTIDAQEAAEDVELPTLMPAE